MSFTALTGQPLGKRKANEQTTEPNKRPQYGDTSMWRSTCMDVTREDGWMSLYRVPAKGTRSIQEFEELTLRRIEMLSVLHQEEGMERLQYQEILKEITSAARGERTQHFKGVFEWVPPVIMESTLMTADLGLRFEKNITQADIIESQRSGRAQSSKGLYDPNESDTLSNIEAYNREWREDKVNTVTDLYRIAFEDDSISHWACRLAFCGEEKWRNWFLKHEETLFKGRLMGLSIPDQQVLLQRHVGLTEVPWSSLGDDVIDALAVMEMRWDHTARRQGAAEVLRSRHKIYYEVDFMDVPGLVRDRKVVVMKGKVYISHEQALGKLVEAFREAVKVGLKEALRARPDIDEREKDRVSAFLNKAVLESMNVIDRNKPGKTSDSVLDIEDIADHAAMHFPLCMRAMDNHLRTTKHLKFDGRFQYGLFLKHAGLSLDQAMKFFSTMMTLKISTAKFAKSEYGYSVRYWYGKEGKKTNYTAQNCATLITAKAPGAGACHGCPFRHLPDTKLRTMLLEPRPVASVKGKEKVMQLNSNIQLKEAQVQDIMKSMAKKRKKLFTEVSTGHYSAACRGYFAAAHPGYPKDSALFTSPGAYYQASLEWAKERAEERPKQ